MREYLNGLSLRKLLILFVAYYGIALTAIVAHYDFNPSVLVHFGHFYMEQNPDLTPPGAVRFLGNESHGGNGYDGQIFYYFARTFWKPGVWPEGFNNAYRAPRVGYPLLAAPLSIFGSWGTFLGLLLSQLILIPAGMFCLYRMLPGNRKYLAAVFLISPFTLQSTAVLVSDSVMIALQMIGFYFFIRIDRGAGRQLDDDLGLIEGGFTHVDWKSWGLSFLFFSLAVLTKESSLFLFFPLGLFALLRKDPPRILLMLGVLLPFALWQVYLRAAHGMVPAGVLTLFLSPLDGVFGLLGAVFQSLADFFKAPSLGAVVAMFKLSAKVLLLVLIVTAVYVLFTGRRRETWTLRLSIVFALLSVLIADYYYFWGVYENISRMFTPLVPLVILLKAQDEKARTAPFFLVLGLLALMVFLRLSLMTPSFPTDTFTPYQGPDYSQHVPLP